MDGLVVEGQHAGGEDTAGGFQVAVAIVNSDDLHVLKLFHNVPLFQFFRVKVMLLIWNSIVWVSLACSRLETLFGSQSVLKRRLLPGKVLARGTRGVTGRSWRYIGQRASGWVVKVLCSVERRQYT